MEPLTAEEREYMEYIFAWRADADRSGGPGDNQMARAGELLRRDKATFHGVKATVIREGIGF